MNQDVRPIDLPIIHCRYMCSPNHTTRAHYSQSIQNWCVRHRWPTSNKSLPLIKVERWRIEHRGPAHRWSMPTTTPCDFLKRLWNKLRCIRGPNCTHISSVPIQNSLYKKKHVCILTSNCCDCISSAEMLKLVQQTIARLGSYLSIGFRELDERKCLRL